MKIQDIVLHIRDRVVVPLVRLSWPRDGRQPASRGCIVLQTKAFNLCAAAAHLRERARRDVVVCYVAAAVAASAIIIAAAAAN